ncbi:MAG: hypothetical protein Q7U75_04625 [Desulfobacterales bacterium]|nr:hypothetical protein [Desulfobacterales bacterium]
MCRKPYRKIFLALLAVAAMIIGCGGGGDSFQASPSGPAIAISWKPPEKTLNNTALDPREDLDYYEIHVSTDGTFSEEDVPVALVAAVEVLPSEDGRFLIKSPITEFDLNLLPNLPAANPLYVSLRAVGTDRQKSAFMEPVLWTRS